MKGFAQQCAGRAWMLAWLLQACSQGDPCPAADLSPLAVKPHYAFVASDYLSSAVGVTDAEGRLLREAWIDSGTTRPVLSSALSGDVVLPNEPAPAGSLALIDRGLGVDALTVLEVPTGEVHAQWSTVTPMLPGETAFRSNPHDAVWIEDAQGEEQVLVSRFEVNLAAGAQDLDRGNDLIFIDGAGAIADRISFASLDVTVDGTWYVARPDTMVKLDSHLVVGLARLSLQWEAGPGAIALVSTQSKKMLDLPLPGFANCSDVRSVPTHPRRALVTCSGATFADPEGRSQGAGMVLVEVTPKSTLEAVAMWRASDHPAAPVVSSGGLSLGNARAIGVAMGHGSGSNRAPDQLVQLDLQTGAWRLIEESSAFALGRGVLSADQSLLLVPDAERGLLRYRVEAGNVTELLGVTDSSPCRGLPVRQIQRLVQ